MAEAENATKWVRPLPGKRSKRVVRQLSDAGRIRAALAKYQKACRDVDTLKKAWCAAIGELAAALLAARDKHPSDKKFGQWLKEQDIELSDQDRAAILHIAKHPDVALPILRKSESLSIRLTWQREIRPAYVDAGYIDNAVKVKRSALVIEGDAREQQATLAAHFEEVVTVAVDQVAEHDPVAERLVDELQTIVNPLVMIGNARRKLQEACRELLALDVPIANILAWVRDESVAYGHAELSATLANAYDNPADAATG